MMMNIGNGFLLALQFFSVIPVKKTLAIDNRQVTYMYAMLPVIGALSGSLVAAAAVLMRDYGDFNSLSIAFVVVAASVLLTGGLHMDGLADVGDAYFSYQDREKRLEIMGDPRIGAFGVMLLLFLILGKIIVVAEVIEEVAFLQIMLIPILSRIGLQFLFSLTKNAKSVGLAAFFQKQAHLRLIVITASLYLVIVGSFFGLVIGWWTIVGLALTLMAAVWAYRRWCLKNFGGITGDLLGAFVEGAELMLWTIILFFI